MWFFQAEQEWTCLEELPGSEVGIPQSTLGSLHGEGAGLPAHRVLELEPLLPAVLNDFKSLLRAGAAFVFLYKVVPASLLKARVGLYKETGKKKPRGCPVCLSDGVGGTLWGGSHTP